MEKMMMTTITGYSSGSTTTSYHPYDTEYSSGSTTISYYPYDDEWTSFFRLATATSTATSTTTYSNCEYFPASYSWNVDDEWYSKIKWFNNKKKWLEKAQSPLDKLKGIIQARHAPMIIVKKSMPLDVDVKEQRARETLMRLIGQERYFRFMKTGFVSAYNKKSGKSYQIFPGSGITKVFKDGQLMARLCVVFNGNFPPTDSIIMRYLLALNDEQKLWDLAIKHDISMQKQEFKLVDVRPLTEILRDLKKKVA